jgi:hypothetical protein
MRRGDFASAWSVSDKILRTRAGVPCWHWPRHEQYLWDGRSLEGKRVLVRCYHGLGDTIQFARFLPRLRAIAREVVLWAQPDLLPLLQNAAGIDRLLPLHDGTPDTEYDADVEIMELAHVFRIKEEDLPGVAAPYLFAGPPRFELRTGREDQFHVGLVWRAGDWDERRSVPIEDVVPLAAIPGVVLHVLQRGPALSDWPAGQGVISGSGQIEELARTMRALDLVITVDSMPAHLAGALGVFTWTLLHTDSDWRWMRGRSDSPWYPTMRLFRQTEEGDWRGVIGKVEREIYRWKLGRRRVL